MKPRKTPKAAPVEPTPPEATPTPPTAPRARSARRKAKAKAVAAPSAVALHPYSVAIQLGWQIRFEVPLDAIAGELESQIKGELE